MLDFDAMREIVDSLGRKKLRMLATIFGIFWGSFMFILLMAAGSGFRNGFNARFEGFAANSFFMWPMKTSIPYQGMPVNRWFPFTNDDIPALRQAVPEIEILAPRLQCGIGEGEECVERGDKSGVFNIFGDYPEYNLIDNAAITAGRFINEMDVRESRKVVVLGDKVYGSLFAAGEDPVGKKISVKGVPFDVIGVLRPMRQDDNRSDSIHIPFTTLQTTFKFGNRVGFFAAKSRDDVPASIPEKKAFQVLAKMHKVAPEDSGAIGSYNSEMMFMKVQTVLYGIRLLAWIVGIGTLLSGMVAVCNIMLMIVKERTKEIGIRRAVGATPFGIVSAITAESLLMTLGAGSVGLVAGTWAVYLGEYLLDKVETPVKFFKNPEIGFEMAIASLGVYALVGLGAALLPALRALSINPTEALRDK